jgi:hypothetical protein
MNFYHAKCVSKSCDLGGSGNVDTKTEVNKALLISGSGAVTGLPIVKTVSVTLIKKWIEIYNASIGNSKICCHSKNLNLPKPGFFTFDSTTVRYRMYGGYV